MAAVRRSARVPKPCERYVPEEIPEDDEDWSGEDDMQTQDDDEDTRSVDSRSAGSLANFVMDDDAPISCYSDPDDPDWEGETEDETTSGESESE